MELLDNIISMGTANDPPPLTAVLRQCIVLANELKAPLLRTWAEQELNGYSDPKAVPDYRIVRVEALGNFVGIAGLQYNARPIPSSILRPEHRWASESLSLTEPVSAYETTRNNPNNSRFYSWQHNMVAYYQDKLLEGCVLMSAWQQVPNTAIIGILDIIRTRVLTMAIDIKNQLEESGSNLKQIKRDSQEAKEVQRIVVNNVYGDLYMTAGDHVVNTQNIAVGKWEDLKEALSQSGIGEDDVKELEQAIQKDGEKMGPDVKGWITRNAAKVRDQGVKIGTSVATTLLTEYLKRHFG
jgi:hypothetical protein